MISYMQSPSSTPLRSRSKLNSTSSVMHHIMSTDSVLSWVLTQSATNPTTQPSGSCRFSARVWLLVSMLHVHLHASIDSFISLQVDGGMTLKRVLSVQASRFVGTWSIQKSAMRCWGLRPRKCRNPVSLSVISTIVYMLLNQMGGAMAGTVRTQGQGVHFSKKRWANALGQFVPCPNMVPTDMEFNSAKQVTAENGNILDLGADAILRVNGELDIGRIFRIAISVDRTYSFVVYHPFRWLGDLDQQLQMPVVVREESYRTTLCSVCPSIYSLPQSQIINHRFV
jgi:hypothetical protein